MSVACVFLTSSADGLGKHVKNPETPGKCYCHSIYGERSFKDFGYLVELRPEATSKDIRESIALSLATGSVLWDPSKMSKETAEEKAQEAWNAGGKVASWGCKWFAEWKNNVEKACSLNQTIVVYYFEKQVGRGKVLCWEDLCKPDVDLWDGVGLGGSQKCEVAFLEKKGYKFEERDVLDFIGHAEDGRGWKHEQMSVHGSVDSQPLLDALLSEIRRHPGLTFMDVAEDAVYRVPQQVRGRVDYDCIRGHAKMQYIGKVNTLMPVLEGVVATEVKNFMASTGAADLERAMMDSVRDLQRCDVVERDVEVEDQAKRRREELRSVEALMKKAKVLGPPVALL